MLIVAGFAACLATTMSCNVTLDGRLVPGCRDAYTFPGHTGQFVELTVAPLDSTLTSTSITLLAPDGDHAVIPSIGGAGTPRMRFLLTSTGEWTVVVGSLNDGDTGRYRLVMRCADASIEAKRKLCMPQPFSCGQTARWEVSPSSCPFSNHGVYANYEVNAINGMEMKFRVHSDDFDPKVAIYDLEVSGDALAHGAGKQSTTDAQLTYTGGTGTYNVAAYSADDTRFGTFTLYGDCAPPPVCVPPLITAQPRSMSIPFGGSATLSVTISASSPLTYAWRDSYGPLPISTSPTLTVTNLRETESYAVQVTNSCGYTTSATATVVVESPHHRAVRH
jgi:hypothetical protein